MEDHDLAAGEFEGVHEGQSRGSGAVIIWDEGTAEMVRDEPGHVSFVLHGRKLSGGFALTRTGERRWILVKVRDEAARPGSDIVTEQPASVRSGRTWQELRRAAIPEAKRGVVQPDGRKEPGPEIASGPAGETGSLRGYRAPSNALKRFQAGKHDDGAEGERHMNMAVDGSRRRPGMSV